MSGRTIVVYSPDYDHSLTHHGVKGQKWGIRRYQPYSTTGGRKSGKSGKEIGIAARVAGAAGEVGSATAKSAYQIGRAAGSGGIKAAKTVGGAISGKVKSISKAHKEKVEKDKAEKERKKKAKLESGNARQILKNKDKFTTEELQKIRDRLKVEQEIAEIKKNDIVRAGVYAKQLASIVKSSYDTADLLLQATTGKNLKELAVERNKKAEDASKETTTGSGDGTTPPGGKPKPGSGDGTTPPDGKPDPGSGTPPGGKSKPDPGSGTPPGGKSKPDPGTGTPPSSKTAPESGGKFDSKSASRDGDGSDVTEAYKTIKKAMDKFKVDHKEAVTVMEIGGKKMVGSSPSLIKDIEEKAKAKSRFMPESKDLGDPTYTKKTDSKIGDEHDNVFKSAKGTREAAKDADSAETYKSYKKSSSSTKTDAAALVKAVSSAPELRATASDTIASMARKTPRVTKTVLAVASIFSPDKASAALERVANPSTPLQRMAGPSEESRSTSSSSYSLGELDSKLGVTGGRSGSIERNSDLYDRTYTEDEKKKQKLTHASVSKRTIQVYAPDCNYLTHHGVKGQHWGIRRYQNPDGSLTEEGKAQRDYDRARIAETYDSISRRKSSKYERRAAREDRKFSKYENRVNQRYEKLKKDNPKLSYSDAANADKRMHDDWMRAFDSKQRAQINRDNAQFHRSLWSKVKKDVTSDYDRAVRKLAKAGMYNPDGAEAVMEYIGMNSSSHVSARAKEQNGSKNVILGVRTAYEYRDDVSRAAGIFDYLMFNDPLYEGKLGKY